MIQIDEKKKSCMKKEILKAHERYCEGVFGCSINNNCSSCLIEFILENYNISKK